MLSDKSVGNGLAFGRTCSRGGHHGEEGARSVNTPVDWTV
jgi:hypothetical protein